MEQTPSHESSETTVISKDFSSLLEDVMAFREASRANAKEVAEAALGLIGTIEVGQQLEVARFSGLADPARIIKADGSGVCSKAVKTRSFVSDLRIAIHGHKKSEGMQFQIGPQEFLEHDDGSPYVNIHVESQPDGQAVIVCTVSHPDRSDSLKRRLHNAIAVLFRS